MSACNEMALDDCFRILKVREGAPWNAVKKSYHALATEFHPDRNPDDPFCENRFKKISLAFEYLEQHYIENHTNAVEKVEDLDADSAMDSEAGPISRQPAPDWKQFADYWAGRVWKFLRDSERMFLMLDVERTVHIDPKTAAQGGSIRIKTPRESFYVTVPDGSADGFSLRIPGKGDAGILNRGRGDLLLRIRVQTGNATIHRTDHYYRVPVSRSDLARGQVRTLRTHQGPIKYTLPENPFHGQTLVLKVPSNTQSQQSTHHIVVINLV